MLSRSLTRLFLQTPKTTFSYKTISLFQGPWSTSGASSPYICSLHQPKHSCLTINNSRESSTKAKSDENSSSSSEQYDGKGQSRDAEHDATTAEDEERFKTDLLEIALTHVPTTGWNVEAISRAAEQAGLSLAVSSMFKDVDLVHFFISQNNLELENHLVNNSNINLREALEWRLRKLVPFSSSYSDAIALISRPENVQKSVGLLLDLADSVAHHALKDKSANLNWYSKRMGIAGIYVATELCLVQDKSEGFSETWKFLERRCQEFEKFGKGEINFSTVPLPDLLNVGFTTVMNLIGRNSRR